tara:strand:+ start:198 stop:779 length:582 start_codon:yes stop_codon:yes gene_type:complete
MGFRKNHDRDESLVSPGRRRILGLAAMAAASFAMAPAIAQVQPRGERVLTFENLHTGEKLKTTYWANGTYIKDNLADINHILRDFRTNDVMPIDPKLLNLLYALKLKVNSNKPFGIISGYRSPATNTMLNANSSGVASRSLHLEGKAIDIRVPGQNLAGLHQAALALRGGGVGYYPGSGFIHMDTGRVRFWNG